MMLLGVLLFALNDTMGKWLLGTYAVGQLMLVRSVAGLCVMAPAIQRVGLSGFRGAPRPGLQVLRAACSTLEASLFFWGVSTLPLAEVMTYYMAGPIYVTALSPLLLGERVGWRRWAAIVAGFCGVVLALHPSPGSLSFGAVCALLGSFFYALFLITTRKLAAVSGTILMTGQLLSSLIFGAAFVLVYGWTSPAARPPCGRSGATSAPTASTSWMPAPSRPCRRRSRRGTDLSISSSTTRAWPSPGASPTSSSPISTG
jgi:S-adenosylmethionine uptake transporter